MRCAGIRVKRTAQEGALHGILEKSRWDADSAMEALPAEPRGLIDAPTFAHAGLRTHLRAPPEMGDTRNDTPRPYPTDAATRATTDVAP